LPILLKLALSLYNLNITDYALPRGNRLALEIFPPEKTDLTITWVDWNPTPPDKATGIWYDITVSSTGPVAIENTRVISKLNLPSTDTAKLTITTELVNTTSKRVTGVLNSKIGDIIFSENPLT
jgi:exo-1,4-beta-D-glucosaminidase